MKHTDTSKGETMEQHIPNADERWMDRKGRKLDVLHVTQSLTGFTARVQGQGVGGPFLIKSDEWRARGFARIA